MTKAFLLTLAVFSLALATGCATGGNGIVPPGPSVTLSLPTDISSEAIYPTQVVSVTATVANSSATALTWNVSGSSCTGSACGTVSPTTTAASPATVTYTAPTTPTQATITATLTANSAVSGTQAVTIVPVVVVVTPVSVSVGEGLTQQFTAIAVPDTAPQTFTWACAATKGVCGNLTQDSNISGLARYTAPGSTGSATVSATWNPPTQVQAFVGQSNVTNIASRLSAGTYAFQFSGYDNSGDAVAAAGGFVLSSGGTVTAGVEDILSATGPHQYSISSVSYTPISSNNDLGTLRIATSSGPTNSYTASVTSSGIFRIIEADGSGQGSGVMVPSAKSSAFNAGAQTFAFGFTGVDVDGNRLGYAGLLPMDGQGNIGNLSIPAMVDVNDNGVASTHSNVAGTYYPDATYSVLWHMTLTPPSGTTQNFDFFIADGAAQTKTGPGSLTLFAITDPASTTTPALSGPMVYQVPMTYNNAAFAGTSVSNLTGVTPGVGNSSNVALIVAVTDGTSGGSGGAGGFSGTYDQNDNGNITSVGPTAPFTNSYVATGSDIGRYTFQMLSNSNSPLPFVLYASGANRGFLLDQSSQAVLTGTMDPQPTNLKGFSYAPSELPGVYAASTVDSSDFSLTPVVQDLLLTSTGNSTYNVTGTQYPLNGNGALTGTYTVTDNSIPAGGVGGTGTIALTSPPPPAVATNAIYALDASNAPGTKTPVITDFWLMGTTSGTPSALIFAEQ